MLINGVHNFTLNNTIRFKTLHKQNPINFKGNIDTFTPRPEIIEGSIKEEDLSQILDTVKNNKPIAQGYTSDVFHMGDKIIKVPKTRTFPNKFFEQLAKEQNLREYYALNTIQNIDPEIAVKPYGIIRDKDRYYLVEEFVKGKHPEESKFRRGHIPDLLAKFFKLDTNCIMNYDIQNGNVLLANDGRAKLIDFGAYTYISNDGRIISIDYTPFEIFKTIPQDSSLEPRFRFLKTFLADNFLDTKTLADNPYLKFPSNATNFEYRTLYTYLRDKKDDKPLEFFREYLKSKAQNYHTKLKEFLEGLSFDEIDTTGFSKTKIDKAKADLKNAITYEKLLQEVLSDAEDDVVKVELSKLQFRSFLDLADSRSSPIENAKKLKAAYSQLVSFLKEGILNSEGNKKEYFRQTLGYFTDNFKDYKFEDNQVPIPDNENLIKILFEQNTIQKEAAQEIKQQTKTNKPIALFSILGAFIALGIAVFIKNKNSKQPKEIQESKEAQKQPDTADKNQDSVLNTLYLAKNLPDTFQKFKSIIA